MRLNEKNIVGIDLAGKPERPTGWACLKGAQIKVKEIFSDEDILEETVRVKPVIVAIDAPLTLPKLGVNRESDREMRRHGYPVLPPLYPAMKMLTYRGVKLAEKLRNQEIDVIEVHPASTRKSLSMPVKDWGGIQRIFKKIGIQGLSGDLSSHELDAVTAAITGYLHIKRDTEKIGDNVEGYIVVPVRKLWREIKL